MMLEEGGGRGRGGVWDGGGGGGEDIRESGVEGTFPGLAIPSLSSFQTRDRDRLNSPDLLMGVVLQYQGGSCRYVSCWGLPL